MSSDPKALKKLLTPFANAIWNEVDDSARLSVAKSDSLDWHILVEIKDHFDRAKENKIRRIAKELGVEAEISEIEDEIAPIVMQG